MDIEKEIERSKAETRRLQAELRAELRALRKCANVLVALQPEMRRKVLDALITASDTEIMQPVQPVRLRPAAD